MKTQMDMRHMQGFATTATDSEAQLILTSRTSISVDQSRICTGQANVNTAHPALYICRSVDSSANINGPPYNNKKIICPATQDVAAGFLSLIETLLAGRSNTRDQVSSSW